MYRPREDNAADKHAGKRRLSYPALCEVESIRIPDPDSLLSPCSERGFQPLESTFTGELNFQPDHVEESPSPVPETANQQQRRYESEKHSKSAALQRRESQHSVPGSVTSIAEPALAPKKEKKVFTRNEIEVAPGVYMPLHGSEETLESMRDDAMKFSPCPICTLDIFCVDVARLILCPSCRVVSPVAAGPKDDRAVLEEGGVGLGISKEEYQSWLQTNTGPEQPCVSLRACF